MSRWDRIISALEFEKLIDNHVESLALPNPNHLKRLLDVYLKDLSDKRMLIGSLPKIRTTSDQYQNVVLNLGHSKEDSKDANMLKFAEGAKLGFVVTLRETFDGSRLLAASYNLLLPPTSAMQFMRIHLEGSTPAAPVEKSRCHMHPGFQHVHLPFPVMEPRAILDRLVFEVIPKFSR